TQEMADPGDRGIVVLFRIFGQQLGRGERAVGTARDDVGKGTAAIDPELPTPRRCGHNNAYSPMLKAYTAVMFFKAMKLLEGMAARAQGKGYGATTVQQEVR